MSTRGLFHISLAAKCRLLFGLAVVLIIGSGLFIPGRMLDELVRDKNKQRARSAALIARAWMDPSNHDWGLQQELLNQWWQDNAPADLKNARPRLIPLPSGNETHTPHHKLLGQVRRTGVSTVNVLVQAMLGTPPVDVRALLPAVLAAAPADFQRRVELMVLRTLRYGNPLLDKVQEDAAEAMRADEKKDEFTAPDTRHPDGPTVHRYLLAIRTTDAHIGRPLQGLVDVTLPAPETDQGIKIARLVMFLAGGLAGFLAILVFYLITQKLILAPVRDLKTLAEQVAEGDLNARAHLDTGDEFEELSIAFNGMLERLEAARVELEKINRSLDIRLGELAETNVTLYESNRLKSEFLANVSHELRTPLTSIIGFADLLRDAAQDDHPFDKNRMARYAHNILISGRGLLEIINDLLDLAKIEAGRVEMHRTTFSPRDVCEALCDFVRPIVDKKGQTLALEIEDDLPLMSSDAGKLRQVLYNLLSNAHKYTPEGGAIRLEAQRLGSDRVRLIVEDNGPGIAEEDQERIFEKFRQLDSSVTREHSGTGLGLAISRELCGLLGGTIRLDSRPGHGARFTVDVPIEAPENVVRPLPSLT